MNYLDDTFQNEMAESLGNLRTTSLAFQEAKNNGQDTTRQYAEVTAATQECLSDFKKLKAVHAIPNEYFVTAVRRILNSTIEPHDVIVSINSIITDNIQGRGKTHRKRRRKRIKRKTYRKKYRHNYRSQ